MRVVVGRSVFRWAWFTITAQGESISFWNADVRVLVYPLSADGPGVDETSGDPEDTVAASQEWTLPALEFEGMWESLVLEKDVKEQLLEFAASMMLFAERGIDPTLIAVNRVVLLHGPPGTGKTTLCKALAQKLAIRFLPRFQHAALLEINAHSLFSKWFSESGKLVTKLFDHIAELVEDKESLVCVLIDEVESLTAARQAAVAGSEPSDAVRVVNALLTQLDALRSQENVLFLTTSNVTDAIDVAFVDRADIKRYIGPPTLEGRYSILRSCLLELERTGIVGAMPELPAKCPSSSSLPTTAPAAASSPWSATPPPSWARTGASEAMVFTDDTPPLAMLVEVARRAEGFSGRGLRKLPLQAHAFFVRTAHCSAQEMLKAMLQAVDQERLARSAMHVG